MPIYEYECMDCGEVSEVLVGMEGGKIVIRPMQQTASGVDEEFARQLAEFIDEYRPALEALAK